ncbi:protealysin inhibitor emfourin [uncultured Pseudomonas sp.]|uniref:protealysin inhibitor emfourin n=1 Tax=uncultured Pseudomonas sp. TaxID=114707 RepID=UPI0025EA4E22|nr:protealysin inhibitor emfourin [uncultured Pseudomonas sp.]
MKVCFVQSGGFVGAVRRYEVDTEQLPDEQAQHLRQLVLDSGLRPSDQVTESQNRDAREYELTIEDQSNTLCLVFDEHNIPQAVRPLLGFLQRQARPDRP